MHKKYYSSFQERIRLFEAMKNKEYIKNKEFYSLFEAYTPIGLQIKFTKMFGFYY